MIAQKKRGFAMPNSKAQAAIFIIIAAIVILSGVLYFFYQREAVEAEVEVVKPEIVPIKLYVNNCIKSVAEDGLETIGLSGGYITIPEKISSNARAYLSAFPGSGFKVPYWWHDGIEAVPSEESIRQQLTAHIESELKSCINNFEPFAGRFDINELKESAVDVRFNENDVSVNLVYPLEIVSKEGELKALIEKFGYTVPVRFKKAYELAKLIMERENRDYFLERKTIDLYSIDPNIPTTDVEAGCRTKVWQLSGIKERLKTLLRVNLPYIRIKGTDYSKELYVPNPSGKSIYSRTYFQQHYVWEIDKDADKKYKNMKVAFTYDGWPLEIYARPSENGILRSDAQKGANLLSFFCLNIWHFTYDISYPVMVTVIDEETEKNKGYRFSFAFMVAVDHNQPDRANKGTALFEAAGDLSQEDYCSDVQNEVTIFTVDNATGDDIRNANLTFVCGRFYCDMGKSDWLSFGAAAGITKRFPYCVNGIIKGSKEGFEEAHSFMQTDVDGRSYVLMMKPVKEFRNYRVVKHLLSSPASAEELAPDEKASILIRGMDTEFESFGVYPNEADFPLKLAGGKDAAYDVSIYVINGENIVGGYLGSWKVSKESLNGADEIVFHVIAQGDVTEDERLLFVSGLSSYSKKVPEPELR